MDALPHKELTNSLIDYVIGVDHEGQRLDLSVSVRESGQIVLFHSHQFRQSVGMFEFNLDNNELHFQFEDGHKRNLGLPLGKDVARYMHNTHQILMVQMDPASGDAVLGKFVPVILHRA
jgi:hypothetical protein